MSEAPRAPSRRPMLVPLVCLLGGLALAFAVERLAPSASTLSLELPPWLAEKLS